LAAREQVQMQVVHRLSCQRSVVYDQAEAGEMLLSRYFPCDDHKVAQDVLMAQLSSGETSKLVTVLGDEDDVDRGLGVDVVEGESLVVFVHDSSRDFARNDVVEKSEFARLRLFGLRSFLQLRKAPEKGPQPSDGEVHY